MCLFQVSVNQITARLPFTRMNLQIDDTGTMYIIHTPSGISIQWYHSTGIMVLQYGAPDNTSTRGLCGQYVRVGWLCAWFLYQRLANCLCMCERLRIAFLTRLLWWKPSGWFPFAQWNGVEKCWGYSCISQQLDGGHIRGDRLFPQSGRQLYHWQLHQMFPNAKSETIFQVPS